MGQGCKEVSRVHSEMGDVVSGVWEDGRMGTFRALTVKPSIYGGTAFTEKGIVAVGGVELNYGKAATIRRQPYLHFYRQ